MTATAEKIAPDYQTRERMDAKLRAIPLPDLYGKRVLDIGCDFGFWSFLAAKNGAIDVLGVDRNRVVKGIGLVDLIEMNRTRAFETGVTACRFEKIELGKQYPIFGHFDVAFCFSVYHHMFEAAGGDHGAIWLWLADHIRLSRSVLLWEGPVDDGDVVVHANVSPAHRANYTRDAILAAASRYFVPEYVGPALHESTREVWRFTPKDLRLSVWSIPGAIRSGAGGATKAFKYANGRRIDEMEHALGWRAFPGSLNVLLAASFPWDRDYFRAQIHDVVDRSNGLDSEWASRWARFYPVRINGEDAYAMRFEGEKYPENFVELIAPWRLLDMVEGPEVTLCSR